MTRASTTKPGPAPTLNSTEFLDTFNGRIVGIVDDVDGDLPTLVEELLDAGVPPAGIHLYAGRDGAAALDPGGTQHDWRRHIRRVLQSLVYEGQLQLAQRELNAGHAVIAVDASDTDADDTADLLRRHHAHDLVHYGRYTWERLGPAA